MWQQMMMCNDEGDDGKQKGKTNHVQRKNVLLGLRRMVEQLL
jgi:hypothetical protein